jgi:hypothetical protein
MCILSSNVIDNIIRKHDISYGGFESMHVTNEIQNLSLLFKMSMNSQIPTNKDFFYHGQLEKTIDWK